MQVANGRGSRSVHDDCIFVQEEKRKQGGDNREMGVGGSESAGDAVAGETGGSGKQRNIILEDEHEDGIVAAACSMQGWRCGLCLAPKAITLHMREDEGHVCVCVWHEPNTHHLRDVFRSSMSKTCICLFRRKL